MQTANIVPVNGTKRHRVELSDSFEFPSSRMNSLGTHPQRFLTALFREPLEYIDHELFAKPSAETLIFGESAELIPGEARFTGIGDDGGCDLTSLTANEPPTAGQEMLLFQRFNYARRQLAELSCDAINQDLPADSLRLLLAWGHRVVTIRELLTRISLPLVPAMAKQTRFQNLDHNDLISEGNCALLRAIMTFDCSRGYRFSTYACRAIIKSFARVILRTARYRNRFPVEYDPELQKDDVVDTRREEQYAACVDELQLMLARNRALLTDVEQTVIRERFALDARDPFNSPKTLDEIGEMIGVTKERVRQIQNKALQKLRHDIEKNYLAA